MKTVGVFEAKTHFSTLRWNIKAASDDKSVELSSLKIIAAFLNTEGGRLLIGVADDRQPLGLGGDHFASDDKMMLHLNSLIKDRIGILQARFIKARVVELAGGVKILRIDCKRSVLPAFVKTDQGELFYVRTGPSTRALSASEISPNIKTWFLRDP